MPTISTRSAAVSSSEPVVDPGSLVYHIDIFLLIAILVFALFNAPRAIARFASRSEWLWGRLHSVTLTRQPRINLNTNSIYLNSDPQKTILDLDGDGTEAMHLQSTPYFPSQSTHDEKAPPSRPLTVLEPASMPQTWHMPMLSSLMNPVASLLHSRVHEKYSLGQIFLMVGYSVVVLYAGLYRSSPFVDFNRSGWVSASQLPFIYILATKNNVIGMLVGVGYEKVCVSGDVTRRNISCITSAELSSSPRWAVCNSCSQRSCYWPQCVSSHAV
jgi:ferric-chelate reductase